MSVYLALLSFAERASGLGAQPGGGTPSVMMSAKMTAREIARDFAVDRAIVDAI